MFKNSVYCHFRECYTEYSDYYIRAIGFDKIKQFQTMSFIVHKPNANRY